MKETYDRLELEITEFETEDVITTSGTEQAPKAPVDHYMTDIR